MPNWCNNNLTLQHEDPAMIKRAADALERGEFLQEFIPVPEDLKIVAGCVGDPVEQAKLVADTARNVEKYGYGNWYDYQVNEWGTKWDVGADGTTDVHPDGKMLHTYFDSAWSPPIAAYEKLTDMGFTVGAMYYEPGMCYAGIWEDGNDDYYDLSGMKSHDVEDQLPSELDEAFGISECMREYEEENQEDEDLTEWLKEGKDANDKLALVGQ
jgi:hypothetical protein